MPFVNIKVTDGPGGQVFPLVVRVQYTVGERLQEAAAPADRWRANGAKGGLDDPRRGGTAAFR